MIKGSLSFNFLETWPVFQGHCTIFRWVKKITSESLLCLKVRCESNNLNFYFIL